MSEQEVARRYPCDDLVPEPTFAAWRGTTVRASAEQVWPWLVQLRAAPYSYDWLDNLGRRSPPEPLGLADPVPGDPFTAVGGRPVGTVLEVSRHEHLTAEVVGATMSYVLVPAGPEAARGATRLLLKLVGTPPRVTVPALALGDLLMARRQLLNLAALAEGRRPPAWWRR